MVVVLALSGLVQAATPLDVNNFSFEYDCDGDQIQRVVPPDSGCIKGWTNSGVWFGATMWCGSELYVAGDCQNVGATDAHVSAWIQGNDIYAYQVTEHSFEAGKRYKIIFDAQGWAADFTPSFFYPADAAYPDSNHIEVESETIRVDMGSDVGPEYWEYDLEVLFNSLPDQSYIGKQIGIKFFNALGGGYVFFDNVRLSWEWATTAWDENPEDGSDEVDKDVVLEWRPGLWAADVNGHEVYLGTSFAEVNDADSSDTTGVYRGPGGVGSYADPCDVTKTIYTYDPPETLSLVTSYYWRIDEVNESYSGSTPPTPPNGRWKGEVWSFEVEGRAKEPYPAGEAGGVVIDVELHWTPGRDAVTHDVYFGTDETAVSNATTASAEFMGNQGPNTFDILVDYDSNGLVYAGEYFWRVDEVGASTVRGHIWGFTAEEYRTVDDFDSYVSTSQLWEVWDDYWVNSSGAEISIVTDANFSRYGNSIEYLYDSAYKDGSTCVGSVIDTDTTRLGTGADWTFGGVKGLVLYFLGDADNSVTAADQLWLQLEDTSSNSGLVLYDDMNDLALTSWSEWNIELSIFDACGVDLTNVDKIHIGFGGPTVGGDCKAGGRGVVYFDEIQLHPPRCVPSYSKGKGDFEGEDCFIDTLDVEALSRDWLEIGGWVSASEAATAPKLWYEFDEGAGSTTANSGSLGSSRDATLIDMFDPWRTPGAPSPDACDPNACLEFDGDNDYATSPNMGIVTNELTISAWLKRPADEFIFAGVLIVPGVNDFNAMSGMQFGSTPDWKSTNTINYVWQSMESTWGWESGLLVPKNLWTFAAAVVEPEKATMWMHDGTEMSSATNIVDHGVVTFSRETHIGLNPKRNNKGNLVRFYDGQMDDLRLYDYALSPSEILYLVDHGGSFYRVLEEWRADADEDNAVDFVDFAHMADNWLAEIMWPEP